MSEAQQAPLVIEDLIAARLWELDLILWNLSVAAATRTSPRGFAGWRASATAFLRARSTFSGACQMR